MRTTIYFSSLMIASAINDSHVEELSTFYAVGFIVCLAVDLYKEFNQSKPKP